MNQKDMKHIKLNSKKIYKLNHIITPNVNRLNISIIVLENVKLGKNNKT